ncbi:MFS transporter [Brachybacterium hainanense]|uniref:MFS transporter n=1 Tax=Brachybacterium hainanense TaxID=1541174 RepID=A0ABV6R890_9MICO
MPHRPLWLLGLFLAALSLGTDEFVIAGLLPEISRDLSVSIGAAGQLVTAFALAFALGAPVLGILCDPLPRRTVLIAALALFALVNVTAAFAPGITTLLLLRIAAGLTAAAISATAFAAAAQAAPEGRQGAFLAIVTAGLTVALFTGVPLGAWFGGLFGWRATFLLIAAVALLALLTIAARLPHLPGQDGGSLAARLAPLRSMPVLRLVLAVTLAGSGGLMLYSYLAPLLAHARGGTSMLPMILLLIGLIGVPSALLGGRLADRLGGRASRMSVLAGHALALALLTIIIGTRAPLPVFLLGLALWSVFAWALNPPLQASTIEAAPGSPMTAVALNISGLYLGTAVAGAAGGVVVETLGAAWIPPIAAALLALALLSASFGTRRAHAPGRADAPGPEACTVS